MKSSFSGLGDSLFDISPSMIFIIEDNAVIASANPFALKELGFQKKSLVGKELTVLFDIPDAEEIKSATEILNWLVSQYKANNFVEVKMNDGRSFRSRVSIGELSECADGCFRRIICIHDSGELDSAITEQGRYKHLLDTALGAIPDGFAVYDEDDRLQIFNKAYAEVYSRSEPVLKLGEKFENILRYGLNAGQYLEAGNTKESRDAWLKDRLKMHNNPTGPVIQNVGDRWLRVEERKLEDGRIVGIRADITQLVEAKTAAEMLGNVLDEMAAPVVFINLETMKFEYANKAALNKLLYTIEEFVNLGPNDINTSLSRDAIDEYIQRAVDNPGTVVSLRSLHRRKDGSTYPCVVSTVFERSGHSKRLISFIRDETEEARMRDELEVQRAELETVVYNLPCFITHSKPDTTLLFANEEYARFYGHELGQMIGKKFVDFDQGTNRSELYNGINALTVESPVFTREEQGKHEDGGRYTILWTNRMLFKGGSPYAIVSVGRDITEIKKTELKIEKQAHQLELRNKALEQFAGIVSHDLRSPLRHIRMFGEMLIEDYEHDKFDNLSQYIGKMREGVLRMERLIASLLEFSQVAYKQVKRSSFLLSAAVDEACENLADSITERNALVCIDGGDVDLHLDYVLFVRLLENLIDNGIKYFDGEGVPEIHIEGAHNIDSAIITVTDNGIGIPAEHSERIFNVFQRLHVDETVYKGTGIGLALAKRIIEGHNGVIVLDQEFVNGTKFVISFPTNI
ncbi:PAS domain S-box protein [Lentilitoribacter sp. Alg239-R112]|uniref:PAS domain S-box protein n=1 Tax=Lentilitoribacter sp. Alg239-R112 TaxID=2305987 RepID=UPI0013A6D547|nr:PAS domain S-box protein [Lentilitoribacter sp. Alg239-R112]